MKKRIAVTTLLLWFASPVMVIAADVVNGWSGETQISHAESDESTTSFILLNTANGCGSDDKWILPKYDTDLSSQQHSALVSAELNDKKVNLQCAKSKVANFVVIN